MRILIVDDDESLAEVTADLLWSIDRPANCIETISFAGDLDTAIRLLPKHDAVLCDGQFPISQDSSFISDGWGAVRREARRCGTHFVLYSGSLRALVDARNSRTPALAEPAAIEEIYAALVGPCLKGRTAAITDESRVAENPAREANYEADA